MVNFIRGNLIIFTMSMLFMFSVAYTMLFYYNQASGQDMNVSPLGETDVQNKTDTETSILSAITSGFVDSLLSFLSLVNPFGLFIILMKVVMPENAFTFLDLLIFRPIGWTGSLIFSNYVISKIRGTEE